MKLISLAASLTLITATAKCAKIEQYPVTESDVSKFENYKDLQSIVPLQCISRQIDNGEHMFDGNGNIIYTSFPKCEETNKPLYFIYGKDEEIKCTVKLEDETYHLFQLYLHQDAPFTCRYELRPESKLYLPFNLNFRGNVEESHFDIDPNLNVLLLNNKQGEIVSGSAFASSLNTTRVIIGDKVELNFNVKWIQVDKEVSESTGIHFYKLPILNSKLTLGIYCASFFFLGVILSIVLSYRRLNKFVKLAESNKVE